MPPLSPSQTHRRRSCRRIVLGLLALLAASTSLACVGSATALASHGQITFFEAPCDLLNPHTRRAAFAQMQALGVTALRVELHWHDVAPSPNSKRKPSFDAEDPTKYNWSAYDPEIVEATRLKWKILLTVTSPVPKWATASHKDTVTRPIAKQFEEFMVAVGRHYPEVTYYALWNEPNISGWLAPQFNANGTPASPRIYRGLFQAGYAGLIKAGLTEPKVLFGELAPFGQDSVNARSEGVEKEVAPLKFLREALCLNNSYRKASTCSTLPATGFGIHPYTYPAVQGPFYRPPNSDQVPIGALSRLSNALDKADAAHGFHGRLPIYITEYGVESVPNALGVSLTQQAEYDAISEQVAWSNPRVQSFAQYLLHDEAPHGGLHGYRTGLETQGGSRKPLYYAWPVPIVIRRTGSGYSLWGLVRPSAEATKVHIYVRSPGSSAFHSLKVVTTSASCYWSLHSSTPGTAWRVSWRSPTGRIYNGPAQGSQ